MPPVYLDYNATAPLRPGVGAIMAQTAEAFPGNPSSPHAFGQAARTELERLRREFATLLGVSAAQVVWTSGGSEANNALLQTLLRLPPGPKPHHVIVSAIEHPSVLRTVEWLTQEWEAGTPAPRMEVSYLPVTPQGQVKVEALAQLLRPETRLVSVMAVNNETGIIQPLGAVREALNAHQQATGQPVWLHSDAVQALGRVEAPLLALNATGPHALTLAAHKLGGPKGIGALVLAENFSLARAPEPKASGIPALVLGGAQERGRRAGTESLPLVAGFVAAAKAAMQGQNALNAQLANYKQQLLQGMAHLPGFFVSGDSGTIKAAVPHTLNFGFAGVSAQSLLVALDLAGYALSTGSACSSGALTPSHVLLAMGMPKAQASCALRLSMGFGTTPQDIAGFLGALTQEVQRLAPKA